MSAGHDDIRDDRVVRAWREHVRDEPPAALDDAIRAAARRAAGAKPQVRPVVAEARKPWRWWMPLAAAATIGAIAIGVLQNMPHDAGEPMVVSDMANARRDAPQTPASPPVPAASAPAPAPMQEAVPQKKIVPPASAPEARDRTPLPMPRMQAAKPDTAAKRSDAPSEAKETFVPPPPADARQLEAGSDKRKQEQVGTLEKRAQATDELARRNERDAGSNFVASPPPASAPLPALAGSAAPAREAKDAAEATAPVPESRAKLRASAPSGQATQAAAGGRAAAEPQAMAVTPPDVFVAEIRRRLVAGDRDGAVRELQRFRRTHADADARLPDDLRTFAASVPR
ncbi:MAG: hypothetical protein ACHQJ7_09150 [Vicinamibacteria bacterium]